MEDRASLLAAVAATPGDDSALAVYADWLAERGEPLGALLHAQLAIAAAGGRAEPGAAKLVAWERQVLRDHEAALAGPRHHPDVRWRYERGEVVGFGHRGLFRAPPPSHNHNAIWLRFFPDGRGLVRWSGSDSRPVAVANSRGGGDGSYGLIIVDDATVRLAITMTFEGSGEVDYVGTLRAGVFDAEITSRINGWHHTAAFELVHTGSKVDSRDPL